ISVAPCLAPEHDKGPGVTCTPGPLTSVGVAGFEPTTSSSRTKRAAKLRHTPSVAAVAATTFTLAHRCPETKSGFGAAADRVRAGVVHDDQEDGQGVEGEAEEEGVAEDALVAVLGDVEEGVEVARRVAGEEFAPGQGEGQVGQGVEHPGRRVAEMGAGRWGEEQPVQQGR